MYKLIPLTFLFILFSCASVPQGQSGFSFDEQIEALSPTELSMANELLTYGLEHEALYTLLDSLKPMSSLGSVLSYPLAKKA